MRRVFVSGKDKWFPKEIPKGEVPSAKKSASLEEQRDFTSFSTNSHIFTFLALFFFSLFFKMCGNVCDWSIFLDANHMIS